MELRFTPTKQDYIKTVRAKFFLGFKKPKAWLPWVAITGLLFIRALLSIFTGDLSDAYFGLIPFGLVGIFYLFFGVLVPRRIGKQAQMHEGRLSKEVQWTLNDDEIIIKDTLTESKLDWGSFCDIVATKEYYLLIHTVNKNMFHFIPKRTFDSLEHEIAFCDLVKRNLPTDTAPSNVKLGRAIMLGYVGLAIISLLVLLVFYFSIVDILAP